MRKLLLVPLVLLAIPAAGAHAQEMVTICHSTGSAENPYTTLTLNNEGVLDHVNHEDDLVPAPPGGCPTTTVVDVEETPTATATPQYAVPTPTATATPAPTPERDRDRDRGDDNGSVEDDGADGGGPTLTTSPPAAQAQDADMQHLPMTGAEMWLVAGFGLSFLLCGLGVRLVIPAGSGRPPGPSGH